MNKHKYIKIRRKGENKTWTLRLEYSVAGGVWQTDDEQTISIDYFRQPWDFEVVETWNSYGNCHICNTPVSCKNICRADPIECAKCLAKRDPSECLRIVAEESLASAKKMTNVQHGKKQERQKESAREMIRKSLEEVVLCDGAHGLYWPMASENALYVAAVNLSKLLDREDKLDDARDIVRELYENVSKTYTRKEQSADKLLWAAEKISKLNEMLGE